MYRRNRKDHRSESGTAPSPPKQSGRETLRRFVNLGTPIPNVEFSPIRLCPAPHPTPPPPPQIGEKAGPAARRESRANATRRGLRSKLLFPLELMESINNLTEKFSL